MNFKLEWNDEWFFFLRYLNFPEKQIPTHVLSCTVKNFQQQKKFASDYNFRIKSVTKQKIKIKRRVLSSLKTKFNHLTKIWGSLTTI